MSDSDPAMASIAAICAKAVSEIMEHAASVRVFVTMHDGGAEETNTYTSGGGNFYAQIGQVAEWLTRMNQITRDNTPKERSDE